MDQELLMVSVLNPGLLRTGVTAQWMRVLLSAADLMMSAMSGEMAGR